LTSSSSDFLEKNDDDCLLCFLSSFSLSFSSFNRSFSSLSRSFCLSFSSSSSFFLSLSLSFSFSFSFSFSRFSLCFSSFLLSFSFSFVRYFSVFSGLNFYFLLLFIILKDSEEMKKMKNEKENEKYTKLINEMSSWMNNNFSIWNGNKNINIINFSSV